MLPRLLKGALILCALPVLLTGCVQRPPDLDFSPDGTRVVVPAGEKNALHVSRPNSTEVEALRGTEGASVPRWSPDGKNIAFMRAGELWTYRLAGGELTRTVQEAKPPYVWSSDSRQIVAIYPREEGGFEACWY